MRDESEEIDLQHEMASDAIAALLSAIVNSSHDAIVSKTLDGVITTWNRAAEEMFGYAAAEAIGRHITLIIPPELRAEEDYVLGRIRGGQGVDHFETVRQRKDGSRLDISLTISPIRNSQGTIIGASKIARDITEKKRFEREREQLLASEQRAREKLAEAVAARDEFIAIAAHELRNPLNVFLLNLQLLHRVSKNPAGVVQMGALIEKTREQLRRIITLVDRLLDVTRVQSGTFELYRETFELCALIQEIAARFTNERSAIPISLELNARMQGRWDRTRIDQAVTNLISNAVKYGMRKPITVSVDGDGGHAVIAVRDQGIGMSPEDLQRVFDRFERAAGRLGNDGLGLGLWITREIVKAHGGTISAQSELGKGSTFVLKLPIQD